MLSPPRYDPERRRESHAAHAGTACSAIFSAEAVMSRIRLNDGSGTVVSTDPCPRSLRQGRSARDNVLWLHRNRRSQVWDRSHARHFFATRSHGRQGL